MNDPEIIAKSFDGKTLYILDNQGGIIFEIAINENNELISI